MKKTEHSTQADNLLFKVSETLRNEMLSLRLPDGYRLEHWKKLSYLTIQRIVLLNANKHDYNTKLIQDHLEKVLNVKNPNGDNAHIQPDGGIIVCVKKNSSAIIEDCLPLLVSEHKHQNSERGNAVERYAKNLDAMRFVCQYETILPYIIFCQGEGFDSEYIKNKLRVGCFCEINPQNINIERIPGIKLSSPIVYTNTTSWEFDNMLNISREVFRQAYNYYVKPLLS